ncbi:SusC/RagA family TonB-linked outer membrane protein [Niastella koreensis]|uniref:TonB-dependent receptor plug n=2 Tax=Niastella koreensis TaxID=354356 RepID=G8TAU9_NIAKG|nr:TonB-dependent receptor [Niastella koreensis]AEW00292.1 TonB-dependent receptor plug [Niastella koreensis GR20-10]OQP52161.1 SusC/RagA family TonB-linked outer membrane protein [Niastella koreensis]
MKENCLPLLCPFARPRSKVALIIVLFLFSTIAAIAQTSRISGVVKNAKGETVEGVTVAVKGNPSVSSTTDAGGRYAINADSNSVLILSHVGFQNLEEKVKGRTVINSLLLESNSALDEVVVIGYGTQKKRDVTGAIQTISAKNIEERQAVSIYAAIQGAAPGVQVLNTSGAPGSSSQIRIRGASTLTEGAAVSPLYIVDGVPRDNIDDINPNDIQSLEILKDAASAAIYGSRSANGVVIVSTKSGSSGMPRISLSYLKSYTTLSHRIPQSNRLERQIFDQYQSIGLAKAPNDSTAFNNNTDNDYQSLITQVGPRNQFDLSISGGAKNVKFFNSLQYLKSEGIILNSFYNRITDRTNIDYALSPKFNLSTRVSFTYTDKNNINEGKVIQQALQRGPQQALYNPDGTYIFNNGGRYNPIAEALYRVNRTKAYNVILYQGMDFRPVRELLIHADVSGDGTLSRNYTFNPAVLSTATPPADDGSDNTDLALRIQSNLYASYSKLFNDVHAVTLMVGGNIENDPHEVAKIAGSTWVSEQVQTLNAATIYTNATTSTSEAYSLLGMYGRFAYSYRGRYLLNATVRRDGSSRFGESNRWGNFPSVSLGWRFSDEKFMNWSSTILTDAKLRLSYGITGNQAIGNYDAQNQFVFGTSTSSFVYNGVGGVQANSQMGNPQLKWESTTQKNIGVDLSFLGGKALLTADYYDKRTDNLLYTVSLPFEAGATTARVNYGSVSNKGIELMLSVTPVRTRDLYWQTGISYSRNKNTIVALPGGDNVKTTGSTTSPMTSWLVAQGQEAGLFYGYTYKGVYAYDQSNAYTNDYKTRLNPVFAVDKGGNVILDGGGHPTLQYYTLPDGSKYGGNPGDTIRQMTVNGAPSRGGDVIWADLDHDGKVTTNDRSVIGHAQPRWYGGWTNSISYKQWTLSFAVYGVFGNNVYNSGAWYNDAMSNSNTTPLPDYIYSNWKYPGQVTNYYAHVNGAGFNTQQVSSKFVEDGTYIRLQSVSVGYSLPAKWCKRVFMQNLRANLFASNLLTWTNYTGFDPAVNQTNVLTPGGDPGTYPAHREIGFALNVIF